MVISLKNIQNVTAYVRKPAESILSTKKISKPIIPETIKYAGEKAQQNLPIAFRIHNNALKTLYPQELARWKDAVTDLKDFSFQGLPSTKHLSKDELETLFNFIKKEFDIEPFILVSQGGRPAMVTRTSPILSKLKSQNFDTMTRSLWAHNDNTFIFNKKATLKNIEKNKKFYIQRLNLAKDTSNEDIYKLLTAEQSPLKNEKESCDLIGILFGFPRKNSMIYKLETDAGLNYMAREDVSTFKQTLLKHLHSPNCVYSKFDDSFKKELEEAIKSITKVGHSKDSNLPLGYTFTNYFSETPEIVRINQKIRDTLASLEKINKANKRAKEEEFIKSLDEFCDPRKELLEFFESLQNKVLKDAQINKKTSLIDTTI